MESEQHITYAVFNDGHVVEGGTPEVDRQTIMGVGSIGKMFTAATVLQLAEEGKFDLDDRLKDKFQGDSPEHEAIRDLLTG